MSENHIMSPAADSKREELKELIALKKGKGGATQLESKQFTDAWVALVKTVGVNDETIGLLYDGFLFAAGEPLYRYVSESRSKTAYASLFSAKPTSINDQGIAFKVAINLLALELPKPTSNETVCLIAHSIPKLSVNKDGKAFGNLSRSIGKILVKPLARKKPDSEIHLSRKDAAALLSILKDPVESFAKNPKIKSVESTAALSLLAWLDDQASAGDGDTSPVRDRSIQSKRPAEGNQMSPTAPRTDVSTGTTPRSIAERPVRVSWEEQPSDTKVCSSAEAIDRAMEEPVVPARRNETAYVSQTQEHGMPEVIAFLKAYQSEFENLQSRFDRVQSERHDALNQISVLKQQVKSAKKESAELQEQAVSLNRRCSELQAELSSQRESNDAMRENLEAAEEMLSTIDNRETRQTDESSRRLARELKVEYTDFMDAADLPMSVDLGENMRDQLRSVFQIIKANGIEL